MAEPSSSSASTATFSPDESEYERRRKENIAANARALAALGLDNVSLKRKEPPVERTPRPYKAKQQRTRISFRHAGLEADAEDEAVVAALQAADSRAPADPRPHQPGEPRAPRSAPAPLTEEQRGSLAAAQGWIAKMRDHYRPLLSDFNLNATMARVTDLASGVGVDLRGLERPAFEGRVVTISDDLIALRREAKAFADFDVGGWRLNRSPISGSNP